MKPERSQKLVLVVDNHPLMLTYMRRLLEKRGDRVLTAEDGLSALKILQNQTPDVIFVDQVMPNISGDKLCRIIRSRERFSDTCVIILSAIAAEAGFKFSEFGANYCIAKGPFDKMSTHILALLYRLDADGKCGFSDRIIGREDVYYRQISRELLYSKKHAEVILNNLSEGVLELTIQGEIVYTNPTAVRILGTPEEDLLGSSLPNLFEASDRERVAQLIERVGTETGASTEELPLDIKGRQIRLDMIHIEDEAHQAVTVIMNDVSRQKQDADTILDREEKHRSLVESLNDIIFETDTDGVVTYINSAVEGIGGYTREEVVGRHFNELLQSDEAATAEQRFRRILNGENLSPFEYRLRSKNGQIRWLRVSSRAHRKGGQLLGARGVATDITGPMLLQQELLRSERLAATGQLAASIAHEINSPLQAIYSMLSSMGKTRTEDEKLQSDLKVVKDAFNSIRDTVNHLLDLNRTDEEGRQRADINRIIEKAAVLLQGHLKAAKVDLHLDLAAGLPELIVSPSQISQILLNLTNNAVEAVGGVSSPKDGWKKRADSGGSLTICTGIESEAVFIRVLDDGPGIAESDLQKVFDPFYTRKKKMGIGVGLSICHRIVEEHGGQISAENRPGGGAQFNIFLPIP
jgi:PAS domain S-box-containing protein